MANSSSVNRFDDPKGSSQLKSAGACAYLFPMRKLCAGRSRNLELCLSELLNILIKPRESCIQSGSWGTRVAQYLLRDLLQTFLRNAGRSKPRPMNRIEPRRHPRSQSTGGLHDEYHYSTFLPGIGQRVLLVTRDLSQCELLLSFLTTIIHMPYNKP